MQDLVMKYLDYKSHRVAETTLNTYRLSLNVFLRWLEQEGIEKPNEDDMNRYRGYLKDNTSLSNATRGKYLVVIKGFFLWACKKGLYNDIADDLPKFKAKSSRGYFTEEEGNMILDSIDISSERGLRNYLMIWLCLHRGLRIIEVQRANETDIETLYNTKCLFIQGKGRIDKNDYIKIDNKYIESLFSKYILLRKAKSDELGTPLFVATSNGCKGSRMAEPTISAILKKIIVDNGFDSKRLTSHSFRHSFATYMVKSGHTIYETKEAMRHSSIITTERYVHEVNAETLHLGRDVDYYLENYNKDTESLKNANIDLVQGINDEELQKEIYNFLFRLKNKSKGGVNNEEPREPEPQKILSIK